MHLDLDVLLPHGASPEDLRELTDVRAFATRLAAQGPFWRQRELRIQLPHAALHLVRGRVVRVWEGEPFRAALPPVTLDCEFAVALPDPDGADDDANAAAAVLEVAMHNAGPDTLLHARLHGRWLPVRAAAGPAGAVARPDGAAASVPVRRATVLVPADSEPGVLVLEVEEGGFLGPARPVAVCSDAGTAADVRALRRWVLAARLEGKPAAQVAAGRDRLLGDIGHLLRLNAHVADAVRDRAEGPPAQPEPEQPGTPAGREPGRTAFENRAWCALFSCCRSPPSRALQGVK